MRRKNRGDGSSLELLLDTICNTFGGVLFVAILIVVMLRLTSTTKASPDDEQVSEAEMLELERQRADLTAMLETLHSAGLQLARDSSLDDQQEQLNQELVEQRQNRQVLLETRLTTLSKIAELQLGIVRTGREIEELSSRLKAAEAKKKALEAELNAEKESRSQHVEYSARRATGKHEIQTVLRYGRLYVWHRYSADGRRLGLNTDEFVVLEETPTAIFSTPMPHAGIAVSSEQDAQDKLRARLSRFDPRKDYIAITVWPDSFGHFGQLKRALVESGFQYRLIPAYVGLKFQDRGGSSDGVQ